MTGTPTRGRITRWAVVTVIAATCLVLGVVGATAVQVTSAAWTNDAWSSVSATTGTWPSASANTCVALKADGSAMPGGTCAVTGVSLATPWGAAGDRQTNGHVLVSASSTYVSFSVELRSAVPADWNWSTSAVVNGNGSYTASSGLACSSLPALTGRSNPTWSTVEIYVVLFEKRSSASGALNCT